MSVDIAKLLAQGFAAYGKPIGFKSCTLIKSVPGVRLPGAVSSGMHSSMVSHAALGQVSEYTAYSIAEGIVQVGDRKVTLMGASIAGGAEPVPGDQIAIGGETFRIVDKGVRADPVKATFACQCRK